MSADAIARVRKLWEKLTFARVGRTIVREPEDVSSVEVRHLIGHDKDGMPIYHGNSRYLGSCRLSDIRPEDRPHATIAWRYFYGFTDEDVYFSLDGYCELDFDIDFTADFSRWGNHTAGFRNRPCDGDWIAGTVIDTRYGKRFDKWFILTPELRFLIELVRAGETGLKDEEIAGRLLVNGFPDVLWAFARLVMFDNVQAFVDNHRNEERLPHPCAGQKYGDRAYNGAQMLVDWRGMYLSKSDSYVVHVLSRRFEPKWWEEYKAAFGGNPPACVGHGGLCPACDAERRESDPDHCYAYDDY